MNCLITSVFLMCSQALNIKKKKITGTSTKWNAKFNCTGLGLISKNGEYNPPKNISNGKYLKNLMLQKVVNSRE